MIALPKLIRYVTLELYFGQTFLFSFHTDQTGSRALRSLGFLIRNIQKFKNELCLKTLYASLVGPILEFCSVLWNSIQISLIESLERVQRLFLRLIAYKRRQHFRY